jgi:hypothetical protein
MDLIAFTLFAVPSIWTPLQIPDGFLACVQIIELLPTNSLPSIVFVSLPIDFTISPMPSKPPDHIIEVIENASLPVCQFVSLSVC